MWFFSLVLPLSALTWRDPSFTTHEISSAKSTRPSDEELVTPCGQEVLTSFLSPGAKQEKTPTSSPRRNHHSAAWFWPLGGLYFPRLLIFPEHQALAFPRRLCASWILNTAIEVASGIPAPKRYPVESFPPPGIPQVIRK